MLTCPHLLECLGESPLPLLPPQPQHTPPFPNKHYLNPYQLQLLKPSVISVRYRDRYLEWTKNHPPVSWPSAHSVSRILPFLQTAGCPPWLPAHRAQTACAPTLVEISAMSPMTRLCSGLRWPDLAPEAVTREKWLVVCCSGKRLFKACALWRDLFRWVGHNY